MIVITGGSGFLGKHVAAAIPRAVAISSRDLDLTDGKAVMDAFAKWKADVVVHLAARVGGIIANTTRSADFLIDNVRIDGNLLAAMRQHPPRHLVTMLSTCVYPNRLDDEDYPMTEDKIDAGEPPPWNAAYAAAKRALFYGTLALHEQYGVPYSTFVPANMYGPGDHFGAHGAHFLADAIDKIERARAAGADSVEFFGTGVAMRQYVYGPDLARLIGAVIEGGPLNTVVNVSSRGHVSVKDLAFSIAKAAGFTGEVRFDAKGLDGQLRKDVSPDKLLDLVPDWADIETPLEKGLSETIDWYRRRATAS